jgi:hypothetical protein
VQAGMIGTCLSENKAWFKQKITVFSYVYTTLPHLTAFDSSRGGRSWKYAFLYSINVKFISSASFSPPLASGLQISLKLIGNKSLSTEGRWGFDENIGKRLKKIVVIGIIVKYLSALFAAADNMLKCPGGLPAIASRSGEAGGHLCALYVAYRTFIK